jgi:hypothetical protein
MRSYIVQCWIRPRSGFDLVRKNKVITSFRHAAEGTLGDPESVGRAITLFEKDHEGMVLEPLIIELPISCRDPASELIKRARTKYPEAELSTWEEVTVPSGTH